MRTGRPRRLALLFAIAILGWSFLAYAILPFGWRHFEREAALANREMLTRTSQGIEGDPINIGLVGTEAELLCVLHAAGWSAANPVTLASSLKIIGSVVFDRPYLSAPVSPLFYEGRQEDLAFQQAAGRSADSRHHMRLWHVLDSGSSVRPVWLGAATFDRSVGLSHYTLQVTHHIAPDIDAERQFVLQTLSAVGSVKNTFEISGVGPAVRNRNGNGDRYFTDGEILFMDLVPDCRLVSRLEPAVLPNPPLVDMKNGLWSWLRPLLNETDPP